MSESTPEEVVDQLFTDAYRAGKRRQLESGPVVAAIRAAVAAERERCAKIAEQYPAWLEHLPKEQNDSRVACKKGIASMIRAAIRAESKEEK